MKITFLKTGKYRYLLMTLFFAPVLFSCNHPLLQKQGKPPLDKQTVENILIEMYLLEGKIRVYLYQETPENLKIWVNSEINKLLKKYNITYKQFTDSYSCYMGDDAKTAKEMMSNITNRLIILETELKRNTKQTDSLNNQKI
jgi:hypothetical protein